MWFPIFLSTAYQRQIGQHWDRTTQRIPDQPGLENMKKENQTTWQTAMANQYQWKDNTETNVTSSTCLMSIVNQFDRWMWKYCKWRHDSRSRHDLNIDDNDYKLSHAANKLYTEKDKTLKLSYVHLWPASARKERKRKEKAVSRLCHTDCPSVVTRLIFGQTDKVWRRKPLTWMKGGTRHRRHVVGSAEDTEATSRAHMRIMQTQEDQHEGHAESLFDKRIWSLRRVRAWHLE